MWIRSQNKYTLINTNAIRICEDDRNYCGDYLICGYQNGYDHELGVYSTFEKALKVLDKIQKYIGSERFYSTTKGISEQQSISSECTKVFKMPQDDEVGL